MLWVDRFPPAEKVEVGTYSLRVRAIRADVVTTGGMGPYRHVYLGRAVGAVLFGPGKWESALSHRGFGALMLTW